jgi:beta-N-acetylhexosaminidase
VVNLVEDVRTDAGRTLERQIRERVPDVNVVYVDSRIADGMSESVLKAVDEAQAVIAAVYAVPVAGRALQGANGLTNSVSLADANAALLQKILDRGAEKTEVLAMGNPYLAQSFPAIQNYLCTFSNVSVAEVSAVKALFGEIAVHGHLPVTIPGIAVRGAGIERPAKVAEGDFQHAHTQSSGQ